MPGSNTESKKEPPIVQRVYRPYDPDRPSTMPGDLREWLPPDHLVYLLGDIVDTLDLSSIVSVYEQGDGRGYPPYHPVTMTRLLSYAYCQGSSVRGSSRARLTRTLPSAS